MVPQGEVTHMAILQWVGLEVCLMPSHHEMMMRALWWILGVVGVLDYPTRVMQTSNHHGKSSSMLQHSQTIITCQKGTQLLATSLMTQSSSVGPWGGCWVLLDVL